MSYIALARKWRPRSFVELIGQEPIAKALINSLNNQRLHHAYLFTGTRGVGKTSIARLMAKALNCEQGLSANPCLSCDACTAIEQGRFIDFIEIDAASKTGVEDTRELMDNVAYAPSAARYKIYLIDEVHMLSQHSFNALLKTLEEPPEHVKFLLATTEAHKLPSTILSRCLQFHLKPLSSEIITQKLRSILEQENFPFEEEALNLLAVAARGSMRDALSLLDQAIASSSLSVSLKDTRVMLGHTQKDYAVELIQALAESDAKKLLAISQQITEEGGQYSYVLDELLHNLYKISVAQALPKDDFFEQDFLAFKQIAQQLTHEDTQLFYQIGIKSVQDIHFAPSERIGFEMALLRMLTFKPASTVSWPSLSFEEARQESLPASIKEVEQPEIAPIAPLIVQETIQETDPIKDSFTDNGTNNFTDNFNEDWSTIITKLKLSGFALNAAQNLILSKKEGTELIFCAEKGHKSLFITTILVRLEQSLSTYFNEKIHISINSQEKSPETPARKKQMKVAEQQQEALASIEADPFLKELQDTFSAVLIDDSIEPV